MSGARKIKPLMPRHIDLEMPTLGLLDSTCVGFSQKLAPEELLRFALDKNVHHLCQKQGHLFDKEVISAHCLIESGESYREFPCATILDPANLNHKAERELIVHEQHFNSSGQKREVLEDLSKLLQLKGLSQTLSDDILSAADEFITNSVFNAPFVDLITHKNPGVSRYNTEIKLEGGRSARIFLAMDEGRLMLGCHDPFGSLDLRRYLAKIKNTYLRGPAAAMNFGPGGAGLGSYIIFNAGSSLYFGVWPGQATILCCVFPLGINNRKRVQLPKHLHWIQR